MTVPHQATPAGSRRGFAAAHARFMLAALALAAALGWLAYLGLLDPDGSADLRGFGSWWARVWSAVPWSATAVLAAVAVIHHVAAAAAVRAASGRPLPWGETIAAQFAASALNRLTPAGLGGDSLNARFLARRGGMGAAESVAAVTALVVLGSLADLAVLCLLLGGLALAGVPGFSVYSTAVVRLATTWSPGAVWWWSLGAIVAVAAAAVGLLLHHRGHSLARRLVTVARGYARMTREIADDPRRMFAVGASSALTTLVLGAGFAAAAVLSGVPVRLFATVLTGYMVASALGNVLPSPGGVGTTDAAFVAVLAAAGMPVAQSTATTLLFRLVTFWLPALVGVPALRSLRARRAV